MSKKNYITYTRRGGIRLNIKKFAQSPEGKQLIKENANSKLARHIRKKRTNNA